MLSLLSALSRKPFGVIKLLPGTSSGDDTVPPVFYSVNKALADLLHYRVVGILRIFRMSN